MTLNHDNYYGPEANWEYMSKSQFSSWQRCEAATLAELRGEYTRPDSTALLVGSFVDAALDSQTELDKFVSEHPEIINSRTKELKADFQGAQYMVERVKSSRLLSMLLDGEKQAILHGTIAGVKFRGKADVILSPQQCELIQKEFPQTVNVLGGMFTDGCIVDLKTTKDFDPVWSEREGRKVSWIEYYGYVYQGAIYRELYRQMYGKTLPFVIVAVSKEKEPDIGTFWIPPEELDAGLRIVEENAPVFEEVKRGRREPIRCESCEWCRRSRVLTGIRSYKEV